MPADDGASPNKQKCLIVNARFGRSDPQEKETEDSNTIFRECIMPETQDPYVEYS